MALPFRLLAWQTHVPPVLIQAALVVFLAYHAWDYFNRAQQMVAQVESKHAEAAQAQAETDAKNTLIKGNTAALATLIAELEKTQADAATAKADAEAQAAKIRGDSVRLATLKAELENTQAESVKAQAEADAQIQIIGGMPAAVAQKKAEVETAEAEAIAKIEAHKIIVKTAINPGWILNGR
jgi:chromosome segregation ATPase